MKIAHTAVVTPHRAGLYETTRDLVAAERALGLDARIIDPVNSGRQGEDRGVPIMGPGWLNECRIIVSHSGLSKAMLATDLPVIHVMHGRPHSSFLLEQAGKIPVYSYLAGAADNPRFAAFVTYWREFLPYFRLLLPVDKLHAITPPVDLERWTPDGPGGYGFHGHKGAVNVVCAEVWRDDKDPFHIIHAFALFAEKHPGAKLHIYAAPQRGNAWAVLRSRLKALGILGEVCDFVSGLENVYRAADVAITSQSMATRSVREPLACGCPVVMAPAQAPYTPYTVNPEHVEAYAFQIAQALEADRANCRRRAETYFDPQQSAHEMVKIVQGVVDGSF